MERYYWNGEIILAHQASDRLYGLAGHKGYPIEELDYIWSARKRCEEARELISELCDYQLEIVI